MVITTHGFIKKADKIAAREIVVAYERRKKFLNDEERPTGKKYYTHEEVVDHYIGKRGTVAREHYEMELRLDLIGEMTRKVRTGRKMTQEELGEKVGVQKAQISKLEKGEAT